MNIKQRPVGRALDQIPGFVQKLIGDPIQVHTGMRTPVDVAVQRIISANDKYLEAAVFGFDRYSLRATVGNFIQFA